MPSFAIGLLIVLASGLGSALATDPKSFTSDPYTSSSPAQKVGDPAPSPMGPKIITPSPSPEEGAKTAPAQPEAAPSANPKAPAIEFSYTGPVEKLPEFNQNVCRQISKMPRGGGYSASSHAMQQLKKSMSLETNGILKLDPAVAEPSFCSGATYLVFLKALAGKQESGKKPLEKAILQKLPVHGQPDGVGVWGRWNANGPGTAMLVKELAIGENFTDWKQARSGDFLKIWWTHEIGAKEHGHSVVFSQVYTNAAREEMLKFWSSNMPGGYGVKEVPMSKAKNLLFSHITKPDEIKNVTGLKATNSFLVSMTSKTVTMEDVKKELGISR